MTKNPEIAPNSTEPAQPKSGQSALSGKADWPKVQRVSRLRPPPTLGEPMPGLTVPGRLPEHDPDVIARAPHVLAETETLLNALIEECHFLMREVAFRSMCETTEGLERMRFMDSAMSLATTGAKVAETVGRLRGVMPADEKRQRMIFEHVQSSSGMGEG